MSAALLCFSFPPWKFEALIWISLVPWFFALTRANLTRKKAVAQGFWLGFIFSGLTFYWVCYVLHQFGELPWVLAIFGFLIFACICQPQFYLLALVFHEWRKKLYSKELSPVAKLIPIIAFALFYAGVDWILPKLFVDTLGHSFYLNPILRQLSDLGGAPLLTFLVVTVNLTIFSLLHDFLNREEPSAWPSFTRHIPAVTMTIILLLFATTYGYFRNEQIKQWMNNPGAQIRKPYRVAMIQGNIGDFDKVAAESGIKAAADKVLQSYFTLSSEALKANPKPEALIWPETAYPSSFRSPYTADELAQDKSVESFVRKNGIPLLFGGYDHQGGQDFNSVFFLNPETAGGLIPNDDLQVYHKNVLLLFGEYIPGAETFNVIKQWFPQVGNFGRGPGPSVFEIPRPQKLAPESSEKTSVLVRMNPVICYEALFPNFVLDAVKKGSQIILNVTNDSWFGPWAEPELHLSLTVFRSIESRRPQLRATNTGITALILPDGSMTHQTPLNTPQAILVDVPVLGPQPTLMLAWGDWFASAALLLGSMAMAFLYYAQEIARSKLSQNAQQLPKE